MLKNDIGFKAGSVWTILCDRGKLSIREIGELTNHKESFIYLALGWLLRENKINCVDRNGTLFFELNFESPEKYYS